MIDLEEIRFRVERDGLTPSKRWATISLEGPVLDRAALLDEVDRLRELLHLLVDDTAPFDRKAGRFVPEDHWCGREHGADCQTCRIYDEVNEAVLPLLRP